MNALSSPTSSIESIIAASADNKANILPLSGKSVLFCSTAQPASRDLCQILESLGAQVFFYPTDQPTDTEQFQNLKLADEGELLALALRSDILIENNANISRWLHDHGLRNFGKPGLIVEQTSDGLAYWQRQPSTPCQVVGSGAIAL